MDQWFYSTFGTDFGPFTFDELIELAKSHQLSAEDMVKLGVDGKPREAGSIGRLVAHLPFRPAKKSIASQDSFTPHDQSNPTPFTTPQMSPTNVTKTKPQRNVTTKPQNIQSGLNVDDDSPMVESNGAQSSSVRPTDEILRQTITSLLATKNRPSLAHIGIDVEQRVVSIRGEMVSEGERLLVIHLLQQVSGILAINDELTVSAKVTSSTAKPPIHRSPIVSTPKRTTPKKPFQIGNYVKPAHLAIAVATLFVMGAAALVLQAASAKRHIAVFPANGSVTLDGNPMSGATVILHPVSRTEEFRGIQPRGIVDADGHFQIGTFDKHDGAPAGDFNATVFLCKPKIVDGETELGPNLAPPIYGKPETSKLKVTIVKGNNELKAFDLKSR